MYSQASQQNSIWFWWQLMRPLYILMVSIILSLKSCINEGRLFYYSRSFCEAFLSLRSFRALTGAPFMPPTALTPSAFMKRYIVHSLCLHEPVTTELNRPNIFYCVYQRSSISVSTICCNLRMYLHRESV